MNSWATAHWMKKWVMLYVHVLYITNQNSWQWCILNVLLFKSDQRHQILSLWYCCTPIVQSLLAKNFQSIPIPIKWGKNWIDNLILAKLQLCTDNQLLTQSLILTLIHVINWMNWQMTFTFKINLDLNRISQQHNQKSSITTLLWHYTPVKIQYIPLFMQWSRLCFCF